MRIFQFRKQIIVAFFVAAFVLLASADTQTSNEEVDLKAKAKGALDSTVTGAKAVGGAISETASSGFDATKNYFGNRTVGGVAEDVAEGAKKVGSAVADKAKSGYDATKNYFSNKTAGDVADDVKDGAKKVGTGIAETSKGAWETVKGWFN